MDIIRGIIGFTESGRMIVDSPFHTYDLKLNEPYTSSLKEGNKLLGVVIKDNYHVLYEFNSSNGHESFGYIVGSPKENTLEIQLIEGFDKLTFNPFEPTYELGDIISENIIDLQKSIKWVQ